LFLQNPVNFLWFGMNKVLPGLDKFNTLRAGNP